MNVNLTPNIFSIREARDRLTELARRVENGETIHVTRHGTPLFDMVPARKTGVNFEGMQRFLDARGIKDPFPWISDDFDEPLPEDFLLRPLP
jgi:prevent-host-death family protein